MDLLQLQTFLAVTETGSFSAAGDKLHCVQSNITARIRKLELELGAAVFVRGKGGARLTPLGERMVPRAREILARVAMVRAELVDAGGGAAPLRLGAMETTAATRLPPILRLLSDRVPGADIQLVTGPSDKLTRMVWERELDAALVVGAVDSDRFRYMPVYEEHLVVVRPINRDAKDALLAFPDGCSYRAAAEIWLRASGLSDTPIRDLGSLATILGCVSAGLGFAVAPASAVQTYNKIYTLNVSPLEPGYDRLIASLIWRFDAAVTRTSETLKALLKESGYEKT